jgi:Rps23 Pro-64 3,4-dihydroxylase Tpa1-like proline 4-hydroxylase
MPPYLVLREYFHAEPKAFTGGALRLYAIGRKEDEDFVDIEAVRNSLLVFPSWAPHEVTPVSCPSKRFSSTRDSLLTVGFTARSRDMTDKHLSGLSKHGWPRRNGRGSLRELCCLVFDSC